MARVTVEDCLENVKNRFELVMLASKRARQLMRGSSEPKVAWENDKATVVALREIAMGYTDFSDAHHADLVPSIPAFLSQPLESSKEPSIEDLSPAEAFAQIDSSTEAAVEATEETLLEAFVEPSADPAEVVETIEEIAHEITEAAPEATIDQPEPNAEPTEATNPETPSNNE